MNLRSSVLIIVLLFMTACSSGIAEVSFPELDKNGYSESEESVTEDSPLPTQTASPKITQEKDKQNIIKDSMTQDLEPSDGIWNPTHDTVVVVVSNFGGLMPITFAQNYIPEMQLFGDGRIIWVTTKPNGSRAVLHGQLTAREMNELLMRIQASGFYSWEERYANPLVMDAPEKCIRVMTLEEEKAVCEYIEGAPEAFGILFEWLAKGAGVVGQPYVPERGYVTSYPIGTTQEQVSGMVFEWDGSYGVQLEALQQGEWLEGKALRVAWQMANASPGMSLIREGETYYQISVQVPGVSLQAPAE